MNKKKRIRFLTLAQKARLSKKKLKRYRKKIEGIKIIRTYTGALVDKKEYNKYKRYIKSKWWSAKREEALEYYQNQCGVCGTRYNLQVHHKHYRTLYKEHMCDLMVLCEAHHKEVHKNNLK